MNITIIGAGNIGSSLGKKWAQAGHSLTFGVRNPGDSKFDELRPIGQVISIPESLISAEVVLLSLPGASVAEFAAQHGANLAGKIIIDATNNVRSPEMNNLAVLREKAPEARFVRAFSTLGWENFVNPQFGDQAADLFYCAQADARAAAEQLISEIGLRPVSLGELEAAPLVDSMTRLWFALVFGLGHGRRLAFKLLEE
jgi:predicted dinucleotide-binding enzyme